MKHSKEINNRDKARKKGERLQVVKKTDTCNTILANSPTWNRIVVNVEWTELCEINQMKKMNVCHVFFFLLLFFFFSCSTFHSADSEE